MEFMEQLKAINKEAREIKEFNIFSALHKEHNERYLHSRFIAYLLSPEAPHGKGDKFLKLFFEYALRLNFEGFEGCEVHPKPNEKSEYKDIDIFIRSKDKAIIIENKIYANDSNKPDGTPQMIGYFQRIEEKDGAKDIKLFYLTPDRREPSLMDKFKERHNLKLIDYPSEITEWLRACIDVTENDFLRRCIEQYKTLVTKLTSDIKRAKKLQKLIGDNIDQAWKELEFIRKMADFKHIKWHTIADFWDELSKELNEAGYSVNKRISIDEITKIAHHEHLRSFGINFITQMEEEWYVVNDEIHGLTFGKILDKPRRKESKDWFLINKKDIRFAKFDNEDTFKLINEKHRKKLIEHIIHEIERHVTA